MTRFVNSTSGCVSRSETMKESRASPGTRAPFAGVPDDLLNNLLEGCQVIGPDWRYLYVNDAVARQGRRSKEELLGRTMMEVYPGIDTTPMFAVLRRCMEDRAARQMENEFTFPDGSKGWFELRFEPVPQGVFILSLEITDRKRAEARVTHAEAQLRQAQKLEAIGQLAGGIAHDFNNLLMVQLGYCDLLERTLRKGDPVTKNLAQIKACAEQAAVLTRQLLAFSRKQVLQPEVLDLNAVVGNIATMLARLIGDDIDLVTSLGDGLGSVKADRGQIEQVIMNLAVNARDAMSRGGNLTIETANVVLDEAYGRRHVGSNLGPHVLLAVTDTGCGMDEETQSRVFEPFFTTKGPGEGTGLGLATVYGIVKQSGGDIWVYSEPGVGTTFKVYLPRVPVEPQERVARETQILPGKGEWVLLVEDNHALREVVAQMIEDLGYRVTAAANGDEAVVTVEEQGLRPHLLVTDMVMPGMGGRALVARLRRNQPDLKVLYASGYPDNALVNQGVLSPEMRFLQKPFTLADLAAKIREALDSE